MNDTSLKHVNSKLKKLPDYFSEEVKIILIF